MASSRMGIKSKPLSIMWKAEYSNQIQVRMLQITQIHISVLFFKKSWVIFTVWDIQFIYIYIYITHTHTHTHTYIHTHTTHTQTHSRVPFNLSSCNLNSVIIQNIRTLVWIPPPPRERARGFINETGRSQVLCLERPPRFSLHQPLWCLLNYCILLQLIQLWGLHKSQKRMVMTLNQQVKEIPKWNTSLNSCAVQVKGH
jgi:hypothetical protein